jgi:hypothetical protein
MVMGLGLLTAAFTGLIWCTWTFLRLLSYCQKEDLQHMVYCYTTRCVVKTSKASADIHKVAGLAVASVVCFSLQSFVVHFFDNPMCAAVERASCTPAS